MTNNSPLVSIILPVFNGQFFLGDSIKSCLNQTYKNFELIIVNDCSTDDSLQIAEFYADLDDRVKIISNKNNKKLPLSLNIGHQVAKGNFYTWTSHDNIFEPNAIRKLIDTIIEKEVDIVYANLNIIETDGIIRKSINPGKFSKLLFGNSIGAVFLYKREVFTRNNGYNESLHSIEDYDFWLRACAHSSFYHIDKVLYNYRVHQNSLSSRLKKNDTKENKRFIENLGKVYLRVANTAGINSEEFIKILIKIHLYEDLNVSKFLEEYSRNLNFLKQICLNMQALSFDELRQDIDIKLRSSILNKKQNQNIKVFVSILKKRPYLLIGYEKKRSFKIIHKCLIS